MLRITSRSIRLLRGRGSPRLLARRLGIAILGVIAALAVARAQETAPAGAHDDPFAWLQPAITVDASMRGRIDRGEIASRVLPAADGQVAVVLIGRLNAEPDRLAQWAESIADLKRSPFVIDVRRFSDPPLLADVDAMTLDDADLDAVSQCVPGSCAIKAGSADIELLRRAATADSGSARVQQQFREIVMSRVSAFDGEGLAGLSPYADRRKPVDAAAVAASLLDDSPYLQTGPLADPAARTSQFYYWSKEQYGAGKRTITVTHVEIVRPAAPFPVRVAVIGREIFASHYRNGSLGLTAVVEDAAGTRYLVYVNRTQVDVISGMFRAFRRAAVEGRLGGEGVRVFREVRRRLESGPPPGTISVATPRRSTPDRPPGQ